ncbi:hypothetical protein ACROYT_G031543 [Oculina patagonica]
MQLFIFLITLGCASVTLASTSKGVKFLGVGYNIIKGNPEGELSRGGVDPGLHSTRRIFKLTWATGKTTVDKKYRVPDQVNFVHRSSCYKTTTYEVISGANSYQDRLKVDVKASDDAEEAKKITFDDQLQQAVQEVPLQDVLFVIGDFKARAWKDNKGSENIMGKNRKKEEWMQQGTWDKITERKQMKEMINSTRTKRVKDRYRKKNQQLDKKVKWMTKKNKKDYVEILAKETEQTAARYAKMKKETSRSHKVFFEKIAVCNRGTARYRLDLARIDKYSVTKDFAAAVCALPVTYRRTSYSRFIDNWGTIASSVTGSGGYGGFSASLSVDVNKFKNFMSDASRFTENKVEFSSGGPNLPEPIGVKLLPIHNAIDDSYYSTLDQRYQCNNLAQRRRNVQRVLKEYPRIKGVSATQDPEVRIPLTWPLGTYGLPETTSGCPKGHFWHKGYRYHDTEDKSPNNNWSNPYDLAGSYGRRNMEQKFCMKTRHQTTPYDLHWPKGEYCIFKKGNCPKGFGVGFIFWDDEDNKNENSKGGSVPDGTYDRNTKINYCCRNDGYATNAIHLPTDSPFVLFKSGTHQCQLVDGTNVRNEWFYWDNEDENGYISDFKGKHPYLEYSHNNIKLHYYSVECFTQGRISQEVASEKEIEYAGPVSVASTEMSSGEHLESDNSELRNHLLSAQNIALETQQPDPEISSSSHVEDSYLINRARAVGVAYEFAKAGSVETEDDRRKRQRRNQRRVSDEERRLREVVGDLPPPPPAGSSQLEDNAYVAIRAFEVEQMTYKFRCCDICQERRLEGKGTANMCSRCRNDKKDPDCKVWSDKNEVDPMSVPEELSDMTDAEQMLISRLAPTVHVHMLKHGGIASRGHCIAFPQAVQEPATILPRLPEEVDIIRVRRQGV